MSHVSNLRSAVWAFRAAGSARRHFSAGSLQDLRLPRVPHVSADAERGVSIGLRLGRATCLVSAAVRQHWHAAQGSARVIVIGVTPPSTGFRAHAWLEGDSPCHSHSFHELLRHRLE